jgi:hypothetical protein
MPVQNLGQFGTVGRIAKKKLKSDNDIKIIIQGRNSQTGIGKTTLAIQLCRFIDDNWGAEDNAFIDTKEYIEAHIEYPEGSALLLDEIEHGADRRRSQSHENVELSQAWAKLRARNIATVCTLPSISMLDSRMLELADYWILVKSRGVAQPYEINVNDFAPWKNPQRKPLPGDEHIRFSDLSEDDTDKEYLDELKDETIKEDGSGFIRKEKHEKELERLEQNTMMETRNEIIQDMYGEFDVTYSEIGSLDSIDMTKQSVGEIIRDT